MQNVGNTWDENWRREKAVIIQEWIEHKRPFFPKNIQKALTGLGNLAGTMILENGMKVAQHPASFKASLENFKIIEEYTEEIEKKLKGE